LNFVGKTLAIKNERLILLREILFCSASVSFLLRKISRKQNERSFFQISVSFLSAMRSILKNERLICLRKISRNENERWFFQASVWFLFAMRSFLKNELLKRERVSPSP